MSFQSYDEVIEFVDDNLADFFAEEFQYSDMNKCPSQTQLIVNQTLEFAKGSKIKGCNFDMSASVKQSSDKFCIDVNDKLKFMSPEDRNAFFDKITNKIKTRIASKLKNKSTFLNQFIEELKLKLNNISPSAQFNCVQNTIAVNDQKVIIKGNMTCDSSSKIKLSSAIFAKMAVKCMSKPAIDTLKMDKKLAKIFRDGDNANCLFDLELTRGCDGKTQEYKVNIVADQRGTGTCKYKNGEMITKPCSFQKCEVGNWEPWSECYNVEGVLTQYRSREITKPGIDCEQFHLREERDCGDNVAKSVARSGNVNGGKISNKNMIYIIILVLLILAGGYFIMKK